MYPYDSSPYNQNVIQDQLKSMLTQTPQPQMEIHVTKVNGRAGADAFNLPPNSDDVVLDMNNPIIYFIQTDGAGYKTVTPYDISIHKEVSQTDQIKSMEERIAKLEEAIANGKPNITTNYAKPKSGDKHNDAGNRSNDQR